MDLRLRLARPDDVPALAALYADTARALGGWCYSPQQVAAWASFGADTPAFRSYIVDAQTFVAEDDAGSLLGFSGADDQGEVHSLYVRHDVLRGGIGTRLLAQVLFHGQARGLKHFCAWATPFSRPVFERAGFALVEVVQGEFAGMLFERYRVERC